MPEWRTYTLSDFLLFSPKTYYRLFELYNRAIWPAQIVLVLAGIGIGGLLRRGSSRVAWALLGACWLWVGIVFQARHYARVNLAAVYFAWAFVFEAALLVWIGTIRSEVALEHASGAAWRIRAARQIGAAMFAFALVAGPLVGLISGRRFSQIEVFGAPPDPTAVATLGLLLPIPGGPGWAAAAVPTLWCLISGATLLAMKSPEAAVPFLAALVATGARIATPGSGA